jgi:NAD(P)-dependent dehydrogenase (short-subunit alcohol dehydrogenase family)
MPDFSDKVVAVTGAGGGIGGETARQLIRSGAHVIAVDVNREGLERLRDESRDKVTVSPCDITDDAAVAAVFADAAKGHGKLDGLVNAAGVVVTGPFLESTFEDWDRAFRVNVWGSYLTIKHAAPYLEASRGRIVNFSSSGGKLANPFTAPYAASKAAIISLTRSAALALSPNVRVNCVVPGIIDTPMWEQLDRDFKAKNIPVSMSSRAAVVPLGRPGYADEVAAAVLFLLSDDSRYITGEDLNISGGQTMF